MNKKKKESSLDELQKQIDLLGRKVRFDAYKFTVLRITSTLLLLFCLYYFTSLSYILVPIVSLIYYYALYYLMIIIPINKRIEVLDRDALVFFEILTLSLESGRNLENSLEITVSNTASELSEEFEITLKEIKYGKSFIEALKDMKRRIPSETVNNIILSITEASTFGGSILSNMYSQIEFLTEKRTFSIRESINKIPNRISIISVLFMVPLMLLLILGPLLVQYIG
jgi:Flp pilus assembly protein TadB